jgi:hypothetical protein
MENGTTQTGVLTGAVLTGASVTFTANAGTTIDWVDFYVEDGSGKITLLEVGTISTTVNKALNFNVTLSDNDGDTVSGGFVVTVDSAAPPVVLDLNGDGLHFLPMSAGTTFDYFGNGELLPTAWASKGDGILAYDANGNGHVDNGSEIVFGANGQTDLQALAATYDTNHDGKLSAADADFGKFGVWQDANSNGVNDAGEFQTLSQAGIVSLNLTSDGQGYTAANGEVEVFGSTTFTRADGSTGLAGDVSFAYGNPTGAGAAPLSLGALARWVEARGFANSGAGFVSALVAAGLVSSDLAAHLGDGISFQGLGDQAFQITGPSSTLGQAATTSPLEHFEVFSSSQELGASVQQLASTPVSHAMMFGQETFSPNSHFGIDLSGAQSPALSALSSGTELAAQSVALSMQGGLANGIPMFSVGAAPAAALGAGSQTAAAAVQADGGAGSQVAQVLADALHGGGEAHQGPSLAQLIEHFTSGDTPVAQLAAHAGGEGSAMYINLGAGAFHFAGVQLGHDFAVAAHDNAGLQG